MSRGVEQIQAEIDKALSEYEKAVDAGDSQEQERLSDLIVDLEVEREWEML